MRVRGSAATRRRCDPAGHRRASRAACSRRLPSACTTSACSSEKSRGLGREHRTRRTSTRTTARPRPCACCGRSTSRTSRVPGVRRRAAAQGSLERHAPRQAIEAELRLGDVGERPLRQRRDRRRGSGSLATERIEAVLAFVVGRERLEAELGDELVDAVLARPDPLAARFDRVDRRRACGSGPRPPTRSRASSTTMSCPLAAQARARGEPGQSGADDDDVDAPAAGIPRRTLPVTRPPYRAGE